ncbi:SWIM zinc finger domain-containing protein [Microbacterium sp.]|uniref:SWIM zinc finger family protein n=1 Tax=Microbacterium sp. TaxID=51671 RepID=UPI00273415DC|nr:DUF6880 family protein [Microbacterium sp.]MDP3951946.1 hypothetical protein [Microbacterium sp.]
MTAAEFPGRAFRRAFARRPVEALTDRRSFERGVLYAVNGRIGKRTVTESNVKAKVRGSSSYQVKLWLEEGRPAFDCSCPVGMDGRFCKHAVAVALVVTDAVEDPNQRAEAVIDIGAYLAGLDHNTLVQLLVERAAQDDVFDARLRMSAARATAGTPPVAVFRHVLDEAFVVHDYVDYRNMYDYASTIDTVLDSLRELLDDGHAEAVVTLAEHAIDRAEDALGYVDDSDGYMSGIADRLQELHHDACAAAKPEPVALARTLFERERHSGDLDVFHNAVATYAQILGPEGIAEYRRLAKAQWDALPPLGPQQEERSYSSQRFRITKIMETLAELTGDVDAVAEVLARDQSSAYQFVRIAGLYRKAGRYDDALAWAEKGLVLHGGSDLRLVEAAAEEYHRASRGSDAVRVAWDAYDASPSLRAYRQLSGQAMRAGLWPDWHDKAITLLRERIAQDQRKPTRGRVGQWAVRGPDGSTLVEVLLYDGNVELAWAEASAIGCRRDLWLELARRREGEHPLEAIPIWQGEIERVINVKNNQAYAEAVDLIVRVRRLLIAADREADFPPYTAKLRTMHKPKRNLMKLFDERSW